MNISSPNANVYGAMMAHWGRMITGTSYWHARQALGSCYRTGELHGYFNDMTAKAAWSGPVGRAGEPLTRRTDGELIAFPTTVLQQALGHWDLALAGDSRHRQRFLALADWALSSQDAQGGWPVWPLLGVERASPYSALTQGEGVSVLVRAHRLVGQGRYLSAAGAAARCLLAAPLARPVPAGLVLDETPGGPTILNGWMFALFGLVDLALVQPLPWVVEAREAALDGLISRMGLYDAGHWSNYDDASHLASPFYHALHIAQLQALEQTFPDRAAAIGPWRRSFLRQAASPACAVRAICGKAWQKLKEPPEVVLR